MNVQRQRLYWEIGIVLSLSLLPAAARSLVTIIERLTLEASLSAQTATLNRPLSSRSGFDLSYQLLNFSFGLAPVALVIYLLWRARAPHFSRLGFGPTPGMRTWRWPAELGYGVLLAAAIGIPGLAFYLCARSIGINTTVVPTALDTHWWVPAVLTLMALRAALVEELIVVAYLFERLRRLNVGPVTIILASALLRGSYHLYQGFGGFIGNVVMGIVFGIVYRRFGRSVPLVFAHLLLDLVSFIGYPFALAWWPELFGAG